MPKPGKGHLRAVRRKIPIPSQLWAATSTVSSIHLSSYHTVTSLLLTTGKKMEKTNVSMLSKNQMHPNQQMFDKKQIPEAYP